MPIAGIVALEPVTSFEVRVAVVSIIVLLLIIGLNLSADIRRAKREILDKLEKR